MYRETPMINFCWRLFLTRLRVIEGGRFDADNNSPEHLNLQLSITQSKYNLEAIKKHCRFQSGYAFQSIDYVESSACVLITIKNISANTINLSNTTFLPNEYFDKYQSFQIIEGDLIIAMTGATIGKVGIFEAEKKALLNQRNGIIRCNTVNTQYLMNLLNTKVYQQIILRNSVGGAQPNISEKDIIKIKIPVPPIEIQTEIANQIQSIRNRAKTLQQEATAILQQAKLQVEQMILGE